MTTVVAAASGSGLAAASTKAAVAASLKVGRLFRWDRPRSHANPGWLSLQAMPCRMNLRRQGLSCKAQEAARDGAAALSGEPGGDGDEPHIPVLMEEVLASFRDVKLGVYVDGTLGAAGHASAVAGEHKELHTLIGIDQDPTALALAKAKLQSAGLEEGGNEVDLNLVRSNFSSLKSVVNKIGGRAVEEGVDGILMDLGMSSMQVDTAERGFSFLYDGPLDMRMDPDGPVTAEEIVNTWSERALGELFRDYGEEKFWRMFASRICVAREAAPITTTKELVAAVGPAPRGKSNKKGKQIHPATRVFQALRIKVNDELGVVERVIPDAIDCLAPGGRLAIISFHSLEDRIVKKAFLAAAGRGQSEVHGIEARIRMEMEGPKPLVKLVTRKPLIAAESETESNARSRSAKLRVVEKL